MVRLGRPTALERHARAADDEWRVAVTFDDGFRSFADVALPELDRCGIPSTLFVPTEWSRRSGSTPRRARRRGRSPLTPELEVAALPASVEVGSHSRNHAHLPSARRRRRCTTSSAGFANRPRRVRPAVTVRYHAFPFGEHDARVDLAARAEPATNAATASSPTEAQVRPTTTSSAGCRSSPPIGRSSSGSRCSAPTGG